MPSILITGASVAGPALALGLAGSDWEVTVVERHDELREEGQNIDVRGAGREAAKRLGVEDAVAAATTGETATVFVDEQGEHVAEFGETTDESPTAELEILRGELSRILVDAAPGAVTYRFGDRIEALEDTGERVEVTFTSGERATYDAVAVAEGLRSSTRALAFGDAEIEPLGADVAYVTIPRTESDTDEWRWFNATEGRSVHLRPDNKGTMRAMLMFVTDPQGYDELDRGEQERVLRERFADAGWETDRILASLEGAPMYYESLAQVHAASWSSGRVVLIGDAAHAPSPMGGYGASLALADGYVLAQELKASPDDPAAAFARFEEVIRPHAEDVQKLPPGTPGLSHPESKAGIAALHLGQKAVASPVGRWISEKLPSSDGVFDLPDYPR